MSARFDTIEHVVLEFDQPQTISRLVYEVEEATRERTQEVRVEVSEVVPLSPAERGVIPVALVEGRLFSKRDHGVARWCAGRRREIALPQ